MGLLQKILYFIISIAFEIWIWVLLIRFVIQKVGISYYHPMSQFLLKITEWLVKPTKKYARIKPKWGYDWSVFVWVVIFCWLDIWLIMFVSKWVMPPLAATIVVAIFSLIRRVISLFFYAIIMRAILSWIPSANPVFSSLLAAVTEPITAPIRRLIPPIAGIDLSLLWAIILLQFILFILPFS